MPTLAVAKSSNAGYHPSYLPVAVIFGGTSGIGQAMTETLAAYLNGRVHIVIVARNKVAADNIIASLPKPTASEAAGSKYEFMACDVTLMKGVHAACRELSERLPKINFLVLSAGVFSFSGREETEEGIDKKMASRYYSRWAIINGLLPSLRKAKEAGEDASVLSILGAGMGPEVDLEDLGLKKGYSGWKAMTQTIGYNDLMIAVCYSISFHHISLTEKLSGICQTGTRDFLYAYLSWYRSYSRLSSVKLALDHPDAASAAHSLAYLYEA
jgi:NAD(P)-dependent dehydrogenase (short-subunit alcohol dehydrogenase family)